jgi:hypothetical protein
VIIVMLLLLLLLLLFFGGISCFALSGIDSSKYPMYCTPFAVFCFSHLFYFLLTATYTELYSRVKLVPLDDNFGPPGHAGTAHLFDALVLSHETLQTGFELNQHRQHVLGLPPLQLLCTRRTEAHGMSSTTLRRLRQARAVSAVSSSMTEQPPPPPE